MSRSSKRVGYILYIDEAGDDGLGSVRPIDPMGASEWLVLGGVLVRAENGIRTVDWVRTFKRSIKGAQRPDIHFYDLSEPKRLEACRYLTTLPLRCFVLISNKKNMRGHTNPRAAKRGGKNPFYNWLLRLLLERATDYCFRRSHHDYGELRTMRIEIAARGGYSLAQFKAYLYVIHQQSRADALYIKRGDLAWDVVDLKEIASFQAAKRAGLQLADVVASSFKHAVELRPDGTCATQYASLLQSHVACDQRGARADYGIKVMPSPFWKAHPTEAQVKILEQYGYSREYLLGEPWP